MQANSVLIVEDEAIVALDLRLQLEGLGYKVLDVASSGEKAIELASLRLPDLILMDVRLQGKLDGIQAADSIRRQRDVPIIFLTSHSDDHTVERAARTAPYGYLTKPYQIKELRAGIEVALTKSRIERKLREADRWFAHTLRCVADGVIIVDLDACVRFLNSAAEKLTGWTMTQAMGRKVDSVVRFKALPRPVQRDSPPEASQLPEDTASLVRSVLVRGHSRPISFTLDLVARDGTETVVDETAGPVDDDDGARLGAVLILRDATRRVAEEGRLSASDERFRSAFDHAPLGMALVSLGGEFIQVNASLCSLLGAPAEVIKKHRHESLAPAEDKNHEILLLDELRQGTQSVVQYERRYARLDGGAPVWTHVSVSLLHEGDQPSCYLYQVHDLTEQKKTAHHLAELGEERTRREASEIASAAKGEFLSRVSHEMRTPLNAVIGFADLLQMTKGMDPAKTEKYAGHIRVAGDHMLTLVTDLLDINRAVQGRLRLRAQPLKLEDVVVESVELLRGLSDAHGIALEVAIPAELSVVADSTRLRQVLLNLGSNAIKYNRQGGSVHFEASTTSDGRVRLTVADTGIGMTSEQLKRLFQPFERLGLERTRIPGVGLGMVIARSLVGEMGGSLTVSSQPRGGTTVAIELAPSA